MSKTCPSCGGELSLCPDCGQTNICQNCHLHIFTLTDVDNPHSLPPVLFDQYISERMDACGITDPEERLVHQEGARFIYDFNKIIGDLWRLLAILSRRATGEPAPNYFQQFMQEKADVGNKAQKELLKQLGSEPESVATMLFEVMQPALEAAITFLKERADKCRQIKSANNN